MNAARSDTQFDVLVAGEGACFRRPEFADDLISYDVIPPVAALRLLQTAVPLEIGRWQLTRIRLLSEIAWQWSKVDGARGAKRLMILSDVRYLITATVAGGKPPARSELQSSLRACTTAFLGLVEYPAKLRLVDGTPPPSPLEGTPAVDLGWMIYDHQGKGRARSRFFRAKLIGGEIDLTPTAVEPLAS